MIFFKKKLSRVSFFLITAILCLSLTREPLSMYRVMGAGQKNCKVILMHRDVEQIRLIVVSWAQGFISGLNLGVSVIDDMMGSAISDENLWENILEKCNKNPLQNLTTISESIFLEINSSISIQN